MFVYLAKKIKILKPIGADGKGGEPVEVWMRSCSLFNISSINFGLIFFFLPQVRVVQWNKDQGWIACGCDDGLLKVLKLDPLSQPKQYEFG